MSWTAGYRDRRGDGQDSGELDRGRALAWLLEEIQRAMVLAADNSAPPAVPH